MSKTKLAYIIATILFVFVGGILFGQYYTSRITATKQAQIAECGTEYQQWQKGINSTTGTDIKVYKVMYSSVEKDCVVATYLALPADSTIGKDTEWLGIDSLSVNGKSYWSQTYTRIMTDSEAIEILDQQLAALQ